jgi:O-antigen/teichoic acid export membrane protein
MNAHHRAGERSFAANALASILGWFVSTLAGFIALPIVVRGLGADAYGLWVLVAAFTGYLGMLDMGLGQTVIRYISFYRERGCGATVLAITRRAIAWFTGAGVVGALVMLVSAPWLVLSAANGCACHTSIGRKLRARNAHESRLGDSASLPTF